MLKPNDEYGGTGVTLGGRSTEAAWDGALQEALERSARHVDRAGEDSRAARGVPVFDAAASDAVLTDMLVDLAPYLFRGKLAGFLTRLSATGLANVTSGGGQVPSFVASARAGQSPMPFDCRHRQTHGSDACLIRLSGRAARLRRACASPGRPTCRRRSRTAIDVAVLDMHHGWPNLGHDAILQAMQNAVCDVSTQLKAAGIGFRVAVVRHPPRPRRCPRPRAGGTRSTSAPAVRATSIRG